MERYNIHSSDLFSMLRRIRALRAQGFKVDGFHRINNSASIFMSRPISD